MNATSAFASARIASATTSPSVDSPPRPRVSVRALRADGRGGDRGHVRVPARDPRGQHAVGRDLVGVGADDPGTALHDPPGHRVHREVADAHRLALRARDHHGRAADLVEDVVVAVAAHPQVHARHPAREPRQVAGGVPRRVGLGRGVADLDHQLRVPALAQRGHEPRRGGRVVLEAQVRHVGRQRHLRGPDVGHAEQPDAHAAAHEQRVAAHPARHPAAACARPRWRRRRRSASRPRVAPGCRPTSRSRGCRRRTRCSRAGSSARPPGGRTAGSRSSCPGRCRRRPPGSCPRGSRPAAGAGARPGPPSRRRRARCGAPSRPAAARRGSRWSRAPARWGSGCWRRAPAPGRGSACRPGPRRSCRSAGCGGTRRARPRSRARSRRPGPPPRTSPGRWRARPPRTAG